jgi:uncharacterized protein (DUF2249 family)
VNISMPVPGENHDRLGRTMSDHTLTIGRSIDRLTSPVPRREALGASCAREALPHAMAWDRTESGPEPWRVRIGRP